MTDRNYRIEAIRSINKASGLKNMLREVFCDDEGYKTCRYKRIGAVDDCKECPITKGQSELDEKISSWQSIAYSKVTAYAV